MTTVARAPSTAAPPNEALPLPESLLGLMVVARMTGNPRLYNVIAELELDPSYDAGAVRTALAGLLAVQPALRMGLHELPEPHGRLIPPPTPASVPLCVVASSKDDFDAALGRARDRVGEIDFELSDPPLVRFMLVSGAGRSMLLLNVHHTVFDGFSIEALVRDLNGLLAGVVDVAALTRRRVAALTRELAAQVKVAGRPDTEESVRIWADRLRAAVDAPLYPRPGRPAETDFRGQRREVRLDAAVSAVVDRTCRTLGVSSFTFWSAVFGATVARHTGATGAVLGTPILSRRTLGAFELCGLFTTTLPLVFGIDWETSFSEFVTGPVAEATAAVKRDTHVPWARVVRELAPSRATSRNAAFSSMIAMQDSTDVLAGKGVRAVRELGNGTAKVDLWLGVTPVGGQWLLELETDEALIPEPVAQEITSSLLQAVWAAAATPARPLRELFADTNADRAFATDGHRCEPPVATLASWLDLVLTAGVPGPAVEDGDLRMDREALNAAVGSAAASLSARGIGVGDVVGLSTNQLSDTIVAMLAVIRAGAAYLPLDLSLPTDRLEYMAARAGCRHVIGTGTVPGTDTVALGQLADGAGRTHAGTGSTAPVYVMFTSGSTGRPKGVLMGDGPLLNLTAWQVAALDLGPDTRFLQYAPLGFDVSFQEIVPTLVAGGTVVSPNADRRDLRAVARRVETAAVTHVYLPVAALRLFVRAADEAGLGFESLRYICVSGEQLVIDSQTRDFFAARPWLTLVNLYGPTETHAVTTEVFAGDGDWPVHAPIGRPITGVSAQVVDVTGRLAPLGVPGELMLGGRCPAEGYVNDAGQTATRFVSDPHGEGAGAVRYRTGDRVMWDETNTLVFLGRDDEQVKISGYRVELGEVEAAALELPGVNHAVAAARGDGPDRHLLLFVVGSADPAVIRAGLAATLPAYMTPRAVLAVESVPKTANGKVDRTALLTAVPDVLDDIVDEGEGTPSQDDPVIAWLEGLWGPKLGRDRVDADRSLFEMGAHSLMVLSVIATIEAERSTTIPLLDFFRRPTLRFLAGYIKGVVQ